MYVYLYHTLHFDIKYKTLQSLNTVYSKYKKDISAIVCDTYYKGIGVLLKNNTILFTNPFDKDRINNVPLVKLSDVPKILYKDLLPLLEKKTTRNYSERY